MGYEQSRYLAMRDAYIDSDGLYFSNHTFNALMFMDMLTNEIQYIKPFEGDETWMKGIHRRVIRYMDSLFFFPDCASGISKYNLNTKEMNFFGGNEEIFELADAIQFGKIVCLVPRSINQSFYLFDMEECQYVSKRSWNLIIMQEFDMNNEIMLWPPCTIGRSFWVLIKGFNIIVETSIDNWVLKFYYFGEKLLFDSITSDGENIWLSAGKNDVIICWNPNRGIINRYNLSKYRNSEVGGDISRLTFAKNRIFVLPKTGTELFIIELTGNIKKLNIQYLTRVQDVTRGAIFPLFSGCVEYERSVYLLPWAADKMYRVNMDEFVIKEYDMIFRDVSIYFKNVIGISNLCKNYNLIYESEEFYGAVNLIDYMHIIENDLWDGGNKEKEERIHGYDIFELTAKE